MKYKSFKYILSIAIIFCVLNLGYTFAQYDDGTDCDKYAWETAKKVCSKKKESSFLGGTFFDFNYCLDEQHDIYYNPNCDLTTEEKEILNRNLIREKSTSLVRYSDLLIEIKSHYKPEFIGIESWLKQLISNNQEQHLLYYNISLLNKDSPYIDAASCKQLHPIYRRFAFEIYYDGCVDGLLSKIKKFLSWDKYYNRADPYTKSLLEEKAIKLSELYFNKRSLLEHWDVILVNKYPSEKCWRTANSFSSFSSMEEAIKFGMEAVNDKKYFTRDLWYPSIEIERRYLYGKNCNRTFVDIFCEVICSPIQCIEAKRKFGTMQTSVKDLYCNPNFIH